MKKAEVDKFINSYCKKNKIALLINPQLSKDDGCCYVELREINLSQKYSSSAIKLAVFFHEVGHLKVESHKAAPFNKFECEFYSWNEGMKLYKKCFEKAFSKKQAEYMLKCLKTYCNSATEFVRFHKDLAEDNS